MPNGSRTVLSHSLANKESHFLPEAFAPGPGCHPTCPHRYHRTAKAQPVTRRGIRRSSGMLSMPSAASSGFRTGLSRNPPGAVIMATPPADCTLCGQGVWAPVVTLTIHDPAVCTVPTFGHAIGPASRSPQPVPAAIGISQWELFGRTTRQSPNARPGPVQTPYAYRSRV